MTRVLLFGAYGFLGGHVRRALAPDAELTCPTRAECDLANSTDDALASLLRTVRPDAVVNCAGGVTGDAPTLIRANTLVTARLIEAVAAHAPAARLVRLGSAAEYGPVPPGHAVNEHDPATPVGVYGVSQLAATRLLELAIVAGRVDGVVLRVFNPIGAGLPEENVLGRAAHLLRRATTQQTPQVSMGALGAYRDFIDVRDVASAVAAALAVPTLPDRIYNIASGRAVPARTAVRLLAETAGFSGEIREDGRAPEHSTVVDWMCGDIRRAASALGWVPTHDLADSVKALWSGGDFRADRTGQPSPSPSPRPMPGPGRRQPQPGQPGGSPRAPRDTRT
ncbi:NAD-dependent epimerase/dehydratase family protein [Micromonospora sp. NPDC003197]